MFPIKPTQKSPESVTTKTFDAHSTPIGSPMRDDAAADAGPLQASGKGDGRVQSDDAPKTRKGFTSAQLSISSPDISKPTI